MAEKTHNLTYSMITKLVGDSIEQQVLMNDPVRDKSEQISRWVVNTRDAGIREALIRLGWTPPQDVALSTPGCYHPGSAVKGLILRDDPFVTHGCSACGQVRRGGKWVDRNETTPPAPIVKPEVLEICRHTKGTTFFPMENVTKCNTCGITLTAQEETELHRLRGFPYG